MILYMVLGAAIIAGGAVLGVAALVALVSGWNALPMYKAPASDRKVFDCEVDFFNE